VDGVAFCVAAVTVLIALAARSTFAVTPNPPNAAIRAVSTYTVIVAPSGDGANNLLDQGVTKLFAAIEFL
jgi:hypothetical protein